jgi:hypothetical protein
MPTIVIKAVEAMATSDDFKSLQLKTKFGSLLYDSTWIAGVEFIEDKEQEEYHYQGNNEDASEAYEDIDPNNLAEILQEDSLQAKLPSNNYPTEQHEDPGAFIEEKDEDAIMGEATEEESTKLCRSTRTAKPTERYQAFKEQGYSQIVQPFSSIVLEDYTVEESKVLATVICQFKERMDTSTIQQGNQFVVIYNLKKGIQEFGIEGRNSVLKEMQQLQDRECFKPIAIGTPTKIERRQALESLIFFTEKKDGSVFAQMEAHSESG